MEHRLITSNDEFLGLQAPWGELHRVARGSLFQKHDWLAAWWNAYSEGRKIAVHTFWNDGLLVGVLPGFIEHKRVGPISFRRMSLMGEDEAYGDYCPLVMPGSYDQIAQSATSVCARELKRGAIEAVDFHGFLAESEFMKAFVGWMSAGARVRYVRQNQPHFVIEGPTSGETFMNAMSKRRRHSLRRQERLLRGEGAELEVVSEWDGGSAFDDFVRLHTARWARDGQPGRFGSKRFAIFLRSVTETLMSQGCARLCFTRHQGKRICGVLNFYVHGTEYQYVIGRDPDHPLMRYSVGEVLSIQVTAQAFDNGIRASDMMGGDYHHKHVTGVSTRWYSRMTAVAGGLVDLRGQSYMVALSTRDALGRLKHRGSRSTTSESAKPESE
jgi:CelD/BcsL family acetyltransferase involved in cellulose biosynthesis